MSLSLFARKAVIGSCLLVAGPAVLFAESSLNPQGVQYAIAGALPGDQVYPQAAIDVNGGYLVWQDNAMTNGLRVKALRLSSNLTPSGPPPFLVSSAATSKTAGNQEKPQVALLPGGAVVVWQGGKPGVQQIWARFLDANGAFIRKDIRVNTYTRTYAINPAVAALADGSVVCVWSSSGQDGSRLGIYGQCLSAAGAKSGKEFQVNQWVANNQRTPAVAALPNGNFVVAWVSELQRDSASVDVYARLYSAAGVPLGDEFPVNISTVNMCANPSIAASSQGGFAVAWSQKENIALGAGSVNGIYVIPGETTRSTNSWDVFGCLFDPNGVATTAPFRLNTLTFGDQYAPRLSALGAHYAAVWTSLGQDGSLEGVYGQLFSANGDLEGAEFRANTTTISRQIQPVVVSNGFNQALVVWSSMVAGTGFDLFGQKYLETDGP